MRKEWHGGAIAAGGEGWISRRHVEGRLIMSIWVRQWNVYIVCIVSAALKRTAGAATDGDESGASRIVAGAFRA